ncbi:MAG: SLATT domain-containing protein [Leptolyngbya sp. SIO3F4]|nr:SLATT domain-containing protein [Leptolyngbya sp. SIO3F4]
MSKEEALSYLERRLDDEINQYNGSRRFYRRQFFRGTMAASILSAFTTVLIALDKALKLEFFSILALVSSASITVISTYDQFLRLLIHTTSAGIHTKLRRLITLNFGRVIFSR